MSKKINRKFRWAKFGSSTNKITDTDKSSVRKHPQITKGLPSKKSTFGDYLKKVEAGVKKENAILQPRKINRRNVQTTTKGGLPKFSAVREDVLQTRVKTHKLIQKNVMVPAGYEIVQNNDGFTSKIAKTQKGVKASETAQEGVVTEKVNIGPHYEDFFTGKIIRIDYSGKTSQAVEMDHVVPASRFEKAGIQTEETFHDKENIVITTADANRREKGASGLHEFVPIKAERYAKKYHDVLVKHGGLMRESEAAAYREHTDLAPTANIAQNPTAPTFEDLAMQQARFDRTRGIQRARR